MLAAMKSFFGLVIQSVMSAIVVALAPTLVAACKLANSLMIMLNGLVLFIK